MRLTIFIYKQTPLMDFAVPYDILKDISDLEILVASHEQGPIPLAGSDVQVADYKALSEIEGTDVLWICGSSHSETAGGTLVDCALELSRLIDQASTVVAIAEGVCILAALGKLQGIQATGPRGTLKSMKRAGALVKKDLLVLDGKYITVESHGHNFELAFTVGKLLQAQTEAGDLKADWLYEPEYRYSSKELPYMGYSALQHQRLLKKHCEKNLKGQKMHSDLRASGYEPGVVSGYYDITFYLFENMRAIDFALTYDILRHFPKTRIRCVSDRRGQVPVEGRGFSLVTDHAIQDVTRTHLLVIGGGEEGIISELNHGYLVHWLERICERSQRVLTLSDGVRYLGVSGILTKYESYIDLNQPIEAGKYMIAPTMTRAADALLQLAKTTYGDKFAKALQRYIVYGYHQ